MKLTEIAENLKILRKLVGYIVPEYLDIRKLYAKRMLRVLTFDQKP